MRNTSPFRKGCERENETSSYIGKCKAVSRSIAYLKDSMKTKGRIAIDRLRYRFSKDLPKTTNRTLSSIVSMPESLGGLGLTVNLERSAENLPEIFRKAYQAILDGKDTSLQIRRCLSSMWKPQMKRGVKVDDFIQNAESQILQIFGMDLSFEEASDEVDPNRIYSNAFRVSLLKRKNIYPVDEIRELVEKPYIVRKLLQGMGEGQETLKVLPIRKRVERAWNTLETIDCVKSAKPISITEIGKAARKARETFFIDLNYMTTCMTLTVENPQILVLDDYGFAISGGRNDIVDLTLKELLLRGCPSLNTTL